MIEEAEKLEKARQPKIKRGRGRNAKKKSVKRTSTFPSDLDAEGYEVPEVRSQIAGLSLSDWWGVSRLVLAKM